MELTHTPTPLTPSTPPQPSPSAVNESELNDLDALMAEDRTASRKPGVFQSPLMKKTQQLDVNLLRQEIPHVHAGKAADEEMNRIRNENEDVTEETWTHLATQVQRGQQAKETLFVAALPLIKIIAHKEWRRRQQWGSSILYEDLIQDAAMGFLKGLNAFHVSSIDTSSTNYLGQWILVEMRRSSEAMDHDLKVSSDAGERFRRIRAIRTRLAEDLGREPTDEEISNASRNPTYVKRPTMVGKVRPSNTAQPTGKGVTKKHVKEERESRNRVGIAARFVTSADHDNSGNLPPGSIDPERTPDHSLLSHDPSDIVAEDAGKNMVTSLVDQAMTVMQLPHEQSSIIALRYGLSPYEKEHSVREISQTLNISRSRVSKVVSAFTEEMTTPGGTFHKCLQQYTAEDILSVGLGWMLDMLGPWHPEYDTTPHTIHTTLTGTTTAQIPFPDTATPTPATGTGTGHTTATQGWYLCPTHRRLFSRTYENRRSVPRNTPCPACGNTSNLTRVTHNT